MSFEVPDSIAPQVQQYALAQHITNEEAVLRLLKAGLASQKAVSDIWGVAAEDADVLDEVVSEAMAERRNRFQRRLNA